MKIGSIVRWSIRNPVILLALYVGILALAVLALFQLPVRMMPYLQSPLVAIVTMASGSSPQEVETYISKPIEQRMTVLDGVRFVRSSSQQDMSLVTVQFAWGQDMQRSLGAVQSVMKSAEGDITIDGFSTRSYWVLPIDPLNRPVLTLALRGSGWDPVRLRDFADNILVDRLKQLPDVQAVSIFGGYRRQLQIIVDREKLAAYGLSILQVRDAIDRNNISKGAGVLTKGDREILVRSDERALGSQTVLDYPIFNQGDRIVYIRDVATVKDSYEERRSGYRYNGSPALGINVIQKPDASSPQVIERVRAELKRIQTQYSGIEFKEAYDNSHLVEIIKEGTIAELLISVALAGLVILIFLEDFRATAMVLISIPTSLAISILPFVPMGMSLNSSTLIGVLLAIGRLVDDSIVVIESVERKLKQGRKPFHAAIEGTQEVFLAIAAATAVMVAALAPMTFAGGLTGIMFVGIVWPIIYALLASLIVSLTLTPLMATYFLKPHHEHQHKATLLKRLLTPFRQGFGWLETSYASMLDLALKNRGIVLAVAIAFIYLGYSLYPFVGQEMMPLADSGQFMVTVEALAGTSFAKTDAIAQKFEQILQKQPEVEKISSEVGFELTSNSTYFSGYSMGGVNSASMIVTLKDRGERTRDIWQVIDAVEALARRTIPGIRRIAMQPMGVDVMATSAAPVQLAVYGEDLDILHRLADQVLSIAEKTPGLKMAHTSSTMTQPEYQLKVDRRRAMELGLSVAEVTEQARYALQGGYTQQYYNLPNRRLNSILVRYNQKDRGNAQDLAATYLTTQDGKQVPLSTVVTLESRKGPSLIEHVNGRRVVYVNGFYRKHAPASMDLSMTVAMQAGAELDFPPGYGLDSMGDMTDMMIEFARLLRGLVLSLILIYLILVVQFGSFIQPLNMMLSIPLELAGVFGALLLAGQTFSTVSILGIIILSGIDVAGAILLIDLILTKRRQKISRDVAIQEAAPIRLKPILMTVIITLVVIIRLAFFPDTGMDAYSPIATVILGGLSISTLLTLIVIPVMHSVVDDGTQLFSRIFKKQYIRKH
ncbi:acriflavine resistance protein B [Nostoc linckia z18]|uniref:Acriflavine resistance protein B n=2 Tax=Nostoc linckia TaxID=92942 RepID=A0A9Q6EN48_NOSLI|nr:efflux RND transporter permease subunit [Nostoc linckia]PHK43143.1 acriflavine resistance protein B [Nostoc linckia z15]PHK48413.1 acriflavine resistance protein B [Nostoc linckia z16]PHJ67322.1 acriflavine resistance protein B [Nostoc linckia z1]PHJ71123.1 acriflavine resistance protein B [Nostoc linckia z3]PHJ76562.1 acriflavine resistance protein B [Nostoc linckia z2]